MSIARGEELYVAWTTRKGLNYVWQIESCTSLDELADRILSDWIKAKHPDVVEHMKVQADADTLFRKSKQPQDPFAAKAKRTPDDIAKYQAA